VIVSGGGWHLSLQVADWRNVKEDRGQYQDPDEWSSDHA
jgi:hypothetical protein